MPALEIKGEPLAPPLRRLAGPQAPPPGPVHALVFSREAQALHELYPLLLDAAAAGQEAVVAVHASWINADGGFAKALWLDEALRPVEGALAATCRAASQQLLHLNPACEDAEHRRLEKLLGVPSLNSWAAAEKLGDKLELARQWRMAGLAVPECIEAKGFAQVEAFLEGRGELILKPRRGTEGRRAFRRRAGPGLAAWCLEEAAFEPMLLCQARDAVRYKGGPVTLRINTSWDGSRALAESGFLQAGPPGAEVASRSRGGRILPLSALEADWREIRATAEAGMRAIARWLGAATPALLGLDLLLDASGPFLLEANARPAGMAYACALGPDGPQNAALVSRGLWKRRALAQIA